MKKIFLICLIVVLGFTAPYNTIVLDKIKTADNRQKSFSFAVLGDNRDGDMILKKIIQDMGQDKDIKFAINNGDLVSDGHKSEFDRYLKIIKSSKVPILSVIGNHEISWYDGKSDYEKMLGKRYFSFSYGNSYFIVVDDSNKKRVAKEQYKWLKKELKKSQNFQNRFVFMHVPLYDPRYGEYAKGHSLKDMKNAKKLNKLFDKYSVTMLFCSHIHSYFIGFWHKTPYIITGGAGAPLKKNGFYHYIKVVVNGDKIAYEIHKISKY